MTREHAPRPGVTWEQQLQQVELPEDEGNPFAWREDGKPLPAPNRAARRALARQARLSGRQPDEAPCRRYDGQPHAPHAWRGFVGPSAWCPGIPAR